MNLDPIFPGTYRTECEVIVAGNGTQPKRIFKADATNGSYLHAIVAANDDTSKECTLLYGKKVTDQADMGVGAVAGLNTITRTVGDFLADGWKIGDRLILHGATTLANNVLAEITAVVAGTLTFAAATFNTNENLPAGTVLYRAGYKGTRAVPANAGINDATAPISMLLQTAWDWLDDSPGRFVTVGGDDAIFAKANAALAANKGIYLTTFGGDF